MNPIRLSARGLTRSFPGVQALAGVDLTLRAGEIHALLGENGAGKSTLIKVLTGVHPAEAGVVEVAGRTLQPRSPREAEAAGISTVYQEVNLIPTLTVAENIVLGRQPGRGGWINWRESRRRAAAALARLGLELEVGAELRRYPIALQQMVAIARALDVQAQVLILDEPTSSLDEHEVAALFRVLRRLRGEGLAILFVTHFLEQVYALTDRLTVLRNGRLVGEYVTAELPRLELIHRMLGRELEPEAPVETMRAAVVESAPTGVAAAACLTVRQLGRRGVLHPLDLDIRAGEVVGLAGLLGSGRTETARLLFGADRPDSGEFLMAGRPVTIHSPRDAIRHGLAFCSEDRRTDGLLPQLSVRENLVLAWQARRGLLRRLTHAEQVQLAEHYIRALNIKTPSPGTPIRNLSGGNQQKVLLARWLAVQPRLIILDEPTRGIDIGAKAEIERLVARLRAEGMAVLFISSELEEVVRASQRLVVLRDRRKLGELLPPCTEADVLRLIAGTDPGES